LKALDYPSFDNKVTEGGAPGVVVVVGLLCRRRTTRAETMQDKYYFFENI
jgi:hypothetical protein